MNKKIVTDRRVFAWAMYDWANSAFATVVMAGFFPIFFKQFWSTGVDASSSTFHLGVANSLASLVIVAVAPVLGAIADQGNARKQFLLLFSSLGIFMTAALFWLAAGQWQMAMAVFVSGTIGFMGANVFYDSLIVDVADEQDYDEVSAFGFALGYLGGGLMFAFCVLMTRRPEWFGLANTEIAVRWSFLLAAGWWAVFSIPLFLYVKDRESRTPDISRRVVLLGFAQLAKTFKQIRHLKMVGLFLLAYWMYIDGVDTIVRMAVDYGLSLGFDQGNLIMALLLTQFVGFPAAIVFGRIAQKIGTKRGLFLGIAVYIAITVWASRMQEVWEFYGLAVTIGLVQGGIQALSRSFYARIIPADKAAEFFGFYNVLGKFAAVIGPLLVGTISLLTENPRLSILSILLLFVCGAGLLYFVDEQRAHLAAQSL